MAGRVRTVRQVSSGGVIARHMRGAWHVCLIARRRDDELIWGLPKGHVEPGERLDQTALREVQEETGLRGRVVTKLGAIRYWFVLRPGERWAPPQARPDQTWRCAKVVHFFLLRYVSGDTNGHDDEVETAEWVPLERAIDQVTFDNERHMLQKAATWLERRSASPSRHAPRSPDEARAP